MGLNPGDLASIRTVLAGFLPDTATITRTGVTVPCRVADDKRDDRLEGLPHFIRLRRWRIVMPDAGQGWDADVKGGDTITVASKGSYYVLDTGNPKSLSVQTTAFCIQSRTVAGQVALPTNATVTFTNPTNPAGAVQAGVVLYDASHDLQIFPDAARYKVAVAYDPALKDTSGKLVSAGWQVTWTQPNGITLTENLSKPRYVYGPLAVAVAYFQTND